MPEATLTCQSCGNDFELPAAVRAKYPNWTPKACMDCRGQDNGGARPAAGKPRERGNSVTRTQNLTLGDVLLRFGGGPQTGVFTDGSCQGNPGPGGWGAVHVRDGTVVSQEYGFDPATTNNRMELTAMVRGLSMLGPGDSIDVYSDSALVVNTLTKWAASWEKAGWKRKEGAVKNLDLVQEAYALAKARPLARIKWLRAHDGSRWNEYADALSTAHLREEL